MLVLTRNEVIDHLNEIIVAPATRTIRGLTSEVLLTADDGMPARASSISTTYRWRSEAEWARLYAA